MSGLSRGAKEPTRSIVSIRNRRGFLAARRGRRAHTDSVIVQARNRRDDLPEIGLGLTCSKRVGNAVVRNRSRRRLREAARIVLEDSGRTGWDYVLIGRFETTATCRFDSLVADLRRALEKIHRDRRAST